MLAEVVCVVFTVLGRFHSLEVMGFELMGGGEGVNGTVHGESGLGMEIEVEIVGNATTTASESHEICSLAGGVVEGKGRRDSDSRGGGDYSSSRRARPPAD